MSLINKMLLELEARRVDADARGDWPAQLRASPEVRPARTFKPIVYAPLTLMGGCLIWYFYLNATLPVNAASTMADRAYVLKLSTELGRMPLVTGDTIDVQTPALTTDQSALPKEQPELASGKVASLETAVSSTTAISANTNNADAGTKRQEQLAGEARSSGSTDSRPALASLSSEPGSATSKDRNKSLNNDKAGEGAEEKVGQGSVKPAPDMAALPAKLVKELTPQQNAENDYRRASGLLQQGRLGEAIAALEQALQLDPKHMPAIQTLVGLLVQTKRHDEAVRRLQDVLMTDRAQPALAMTLARLQVDRNDVKGAIDTLQISLPHGSQRPDYQAFLAALYQREGRNKEAIDLYTLALDKAPQNGIWWMGLGISLQAQKRFREAQEAYQHAKESAMLNTELQAFVSNKIAELR